MLDMEFWDLMFAILGFVLGWFLFLPTPYSSLLEWEYLPRAVVCQTYLVLFFILQVLTCKRLPLIS